MKRDLYAEVSARIVAELEAGAAPWVKPWSTSPGANTPCNAVGSRNIAESHGRPKRVRSTNPALRPASQLRLPLRRKGMTLALAFPSRAAEMTLTTRSAARFPG
jgi:hypothetical protein